VNGRRGYELARAGVEFELAPKKVHIFGMELLGKAETENTYRIKIRCGGGTYIRSLARDIATELGTKAVMSALRRTQSGIFTLQNAIPFDVLEKDPPLEELEKYLIPTDSVLPFETLSLTEAELGKILQGQRVKTDVADGLYKIYTPDGFYGLAEVLDGLAKAKTKLC
jgi:tRNA pseudouridine55 synthase